LLKRQGKSDEAEKLRAEWPETLADEHPTSDAKGDK
jgi:hypothetical protein